MAPKLADGVADTRYAQWMGLGLVGDFATYKARRMSEIDALNKDPLNPLIPVNVVNQLRRVAVRLEYTR